MALIAASVPILASFEVAVFFSRLSKSELASLEPTYRDTMALNACKKQ